MQKQTKYALQKKTIKYIDILSGRGNKLSLQLTQLKIHPDHY